MAADIIVNARASRPSVCNSLDCAIVDAAILDELAQLLKAGLEKYKVEVYADEKAFISFKSANYPYLKHAREEDFGKEWLDFKLSVKTVSTPEEALEHVEKYSSRHSEAIITEDHDLAERFLNEVDAAAVYHNASTRFTDGGSLVWVPKSVFQPKTTCPRTICPRKTGDRKMGLSWRRASKMVRRLAIDSVLDRRF